ncbi:GNAT family N-acetyltransferase [Conservatibacter flavescens]|nr:GNAT family N-acetyltransferase [Conservatibacter flavescens]
MEYKIIKYSDINPDSLKDIFKHLSLNCLVTESQVKEEIKGFLPAYPEIIEWYQKVIKEIEKKPSSRDMFISLSNENNSFVISGLMILKKTENEKKICTLRVKDNYQKKGIGSILMGMAFDFLETKKPLITVPEESVDNFSKIFNKFDFQEVEKISDLYRKNKIEYIYNGHFK